MANRQSKDGGGVVRIHLDVTNLERSAAFYERALGFRVAFVHRQGVPYESWVLSSERHPGVLLVMRQSYRRPVVGSAPGGVTRLALHEPDLEARRAEIEGLVALIPPTDRGAPGSAAGDGSYIEFLDPDGYVLELYSG
jgi:catechol 2,3-dioxygenase-like lactoylglutathione lyase family enzyme